MTNLSKEKIGIGFYNRYFKQNAESRYGVEMANFLYFRKGKFLNPRKKDEYIEQYTKEEIENFFDKGELNIPHITFCITTKCSLSCKNCSSLIPKFDNETHIDMSVDEFKSSLDKICSVASKIRRLVFLGGERLLHKEFDKILEYACSKENIDLVEIITNGTVIPNKSVLETIRKFNKKAYFYISNYSTNKALLHRLKHEEIRAALKEYNIKMQIVDVIGWFKEYGFTKEPSDTAVTTERFNKCFCSHSTHALNSKIYICSKASCAIELGLVDVDDYIDINNSKDLIQDFINFYNKNYLKACEYCILSDETIFPALQIENKL